MRRTEQDVNTDLNAEPVGGMQAASAIPATAAAAGGDVGVGETAPDATAVARYLRRNPAFLAQHPELYAALHPPRRVHGDGVTDHMAAMLAAERARSTEALARRRTESALAARVEDAVLALLRTADPLGCLAHELPERLGIDAVALCAEADLPGARWLPPRTVARLLGGRQAIVRAAPTDERLLHGSAASLARSDALVRVPLAVPALLALASRDAAALEGDAAGSGAGLTLGFLGRAVAAALERL